MPSFLRRLRSTSKLHSPRSEPTSPPPKRPESPSQHLPARSYSRPPSPTKLRAAPPRRGYEVLQGEHGASPQDDERSTSPLVDSWTLDEGDDPGELGCWEWVEVEPAGATPVRTAALDPRTVRRHEPPRLHLEPDDAPPLVPFSSTYSLAPPPFGDRPVTPTKRKASMSSPDLSPSASFSSAVLSPSPASPSSVSSLAPTPSSPTPSVSLSLSIATRIDHNGRRVLTSRRRLSLKPSPSECRRNKDAYGIGDEASGDESDAGNDGPLGKGGARLDGELSLELPTTGLGMVDLKSPLFDDDELEGPTLNLPSSPPGARPPRGRPVSLQPLAIPPPTRACRSPLPSPSLARQVLPEHQPIKTFWPPPPLDPPSPTRSSAFSALTRSNTSYSMSSSSGSPTKRHKSLGQPRRTGTFRRLSLSRASVSFGPPTMSATTFSSLHERRASAPTLPQLGGAFLERHTSLSSLGSAGGLSVPPTSSSSHVSFATTSGSTSTGEPLLARQQSASSVSGMSPPCTPRRASQVSFELPPASPSDARRAAAAAAGVGEGSAAASDEGYASAAGLQSQPLTPSSSVGRASRRHARAASEGGGAAVAAALKMRVIERTWVPLDDQAESELARGRLVVVNPDSSASSSSLSHSNSLSSTPPSSPPCSPNFSRPGRPSRPAKSLGRWSAPPPSFLASSPPSPPLPPPSELQGIGVAC